MTRFIQVHEADNYFVFGIQSKRNGLYVNREYRPTQSSIARINRILSTSEPFLSGHHWNVDVRFYQIKKVTI